MAGMKAAITTHKIKHIYIYIYILLIYSTIYNIFTPKLTEEIEPLIKNTQMVKDHINFCNEHGGMWTSAILAVEDSSEQRKRITYRHR